MESEAETELQQLQYVGLGKQKAPEIKEEEEEIC